MREKFSQPWLKLDRITGLVQLEPALLVFGLTIAAWLIYRLLLKEVSSERHANLQRLFKNLTFHLSLLTFWFASYSAISLLLETTEVSVALGRLNSYIGLFAIIWGAICFVKVWRILTFEYLFLGHMKVGVPLLIVNLVSLVLSIGLGLWISAEVFGLQVAPVLAGSAVASLVLGLAMQETLGNLFSGVALQFDKPYELGDWIEVQNGPTKWVGQVDDISWRATVIIGLSDELITVPNRVIAGSLISNFSLRKKPICRSHTFRIHLTENLESVRETLLKSLVGISEILPLPAPIVLITDTTDAYALAKLVYFINDYGKQWTVGDRVLEAALKNLNEANIEIASNRIQILRENQSLDA